MTEQLATRAPETARRSARAASATGASQGMAVLSYLIGGMAFYGGLGWLGSHLLHQTWMIPIGMLIGIALAVLMIVRRYARAEVMDAEIERLIADRARERQYWTEQARRG